MAILGGRMDRYLNAVRNLQESVTQLREAYQSQLSIQQNDLMKIFTVVTAVFLFYTFGPLGSGQARYSWFIWAIAGVVYAACVVAAKAFVRKKV